jgi:hypothetical protein
LPCSHELANTLAVIGILACIAHSNIATLPQKYAAFDLISLFSFFRFMRCILLSVVLLISRYGKIQPLGIYSDTHDIISSLRNISLNIIFE